MTTCPARKTHITQSSTRLSAKREANIMSGSDSSMTLQAYTVMTAPITDSLTPRSEAMSVSKATGMNSEVLKIKADKVMPSNGSHCRNPIFSSLAFCASSSIPPSSLPNLTLKLRRQF